MSLGLENLNLGLSVCMNNDINDYKKMVDNYYIIGYKLCESITKLDSSTNTSYIKFKYENNCGKLDIIEIEIEYSNIKIIALNSYHIPNNILPNKFKNVSNVSKYNFEDLYKLYDYVSEPNNINKISMFSIKIIENDKMFTITDKRYNIYLLSDEIKTESNYLPSKCIIKNFIKNILVPL